MGGACSSMKLTSFLGSSEDTGNEVGRKRHYGKGKNLLHSIYIYTLIEVYNFGVEIEM